MSWRFRHFVREIEVTLEPLKWRPRGEDFAERELRAAFLSSLRSGDPEVLRIARAVVVEGSRHGLRGFAAADVMASTSASALAALGEGLFDEVVRFRRVPTWIGGGAGGASPRPDAGEPAGSGAGGPGPVRPLVSPPRIVVLVQKTAKNPSDGKQTPYTAARRRPLTLRTDTSFDGSATLTCDHPERVRFFPQASGGTAIAFDGVDNVFLSGKAPAWAPAGANIVAGVTVYVEGVAPSAGIDDIQVRLALAGGSAPIGPDAVETITSVEVTLDIHKSSPSAAGAPAFSQDDKVHVGRDLLVQRPTGGAPRAKLVVRQVRPADFKGTLSVQAVDTRVTAYAAEKPVAGEASALPFEIAAAAVPASGAVLWAQAHGVSAALRDTGFRLGIKGVDDEGDRVNATAIELTLEICRSRTGALTDPTPLSADDKQKIGRFVHEQDADGHHGRALLLVRAVRPAQYVGTVVLAAVASSTELFPNERPTVGEVAAAVPLEYDLAKQKNEDHKLWVQGKTVSSALRDAGYVLHLKDDPRDSGDAVAVTVCKFTDLEADIPSTPAYTSRLGNFPVGRHPFAIAGTSPDHFDEDPAKNLPVALVEGSIRTAAPADPIKLRVRVAPSGTPVLWSVLRDTRSAPHGDHPNVVAMAGPPTHRPDVAAPAEPLRRELLADGVGTFHVRPFVDCSGTGKYQQHIDSEPYILMILVLIRVEGHTNTSVAQPNNAFAWVKNRAGNGAPSSTGGVQVKTGDFASGTNDAVHQVASVTVTGGGGDGRRGLDMLFAGWLNNELDTPGSLVSGEDVVATYDHTQPMPQPVLQRQHVSIRVGNRSTYYYLPPGAPPPSERGPMLDTSLEVGAGTGGNTAIGTEGAPGPPTPIVKTNLPVGQRWTVEMWDSPGDEASPVHAAYSPTRLVAYRFNLDFRSDLVFWTNTTRVAGASANDPAHRLYASVQTNQWFIRLALAFDAAGVAVAPPTVASVTLTRDGVTTRRAVPCDGMACETRGPALLTMIAIDATR